MSTPVEELVELEKIKRLKAKYFRTIDLQAWEEYADCFTRDVRIQADRGGGLDPLVFEGRDRYIEGVQAVLEGVAHVHHGHTPEIDILSPTEARGIWALHDHLLYPDRSVHGYGHYHETYRKEEDGQWRIATLRITRLIYELQPRGAELQPA